MPRLAIKAIFTCEGGRVEEQEIAKHLLEMSKEYTVKDAKISGWETSITLEEFPGSWNSCLFDVDFNLLLKQYGGERYANELS